MQAEAVMLSCPGIAWGLHKHRRAQTDLHTEAAACLPQQHPQQSRFTYMFAVTELAHPQRLHGLHWVSECVRRLTQHMRMPAALHY